MNKRYKEGLIIGKFYPFHKGHQFLLETALSQSEHVSVIVCHTPLYDIDPKIRAEWIRELYPLVSVIVFRHDPYLDSPSLSISKQWADITIDILGFSPDCVFSSEDYGSHYAGHMGSEHVLVDKERTTIPISGTMARDDPYKSWQYLSEPVRAYFAKRIVILGAESTGTTTLAMDLARHFRTSWVPEYGRSYAEGRLFTENADKWKTEEFAHIATVQNTVENELARKSNRLLICDTDAFATRLWHERYMGFLSPELEALVNTQNKSLYILTGDEIPFVQDGTRDGEQIRHKMHRSFIEELKSNQLNYIEVNGTKTDRLSKAVEEINKLFEHD